MVPMVYTSIQHGPLPSPHHACTHHHLGHQEHGTSHVPRHTTTRARARSRRARHRYTCKYCKQPGGLPESHWHVECPQKPADWAERGFFSQLRLGAYRRRAPRGYDGSEGSIEEVSKNNSKECRQLPIRSARAVGVPCLACSRDEVRKKKKRTRPEQRKPAGRR